MSYSDFAEDAINNAICNNTPFSVAQIYVKLHIGDPGEAGTAFPAVETTRKAASFGASVAGVCLNDALISWSGVAATETYSHVSFWDSSSAGNCWGSGALATAQAVTAGQTAEIAVGALSLTTT